MRLAIVLSLGILLALGVIIMAQQQSKAPAQESPSSGSQSKTGCEADQQAAQFDCLPDEISLKDVVTYRRNAEKNVTVKDTLLELKAVCKDSKLVDDGGKEIRFFRMQCWGNPPADYRERQKRQQDELKELQKKYTVVVMGCNPFMS
jgi:hypothetical protein